MNSFVSVFSIVFSLLFLKRKAFNASEELSTLCWFICQYSICATLHWIVDSDELKPLGKCAGLVSKAMSRTSLAMLKEKEIFQNQKRIGNNFECECFHQGFYSNPAIKLNHSIARMFKFQKSSSVVCGVAFMKLQQFRETVLDKFWHIAYI